MAGHQVEKPSKQAEVDAIAWELDKMTAREFVVPGLNRYKVTGEGHGTQGTFEPVAKVAG